jgi:hypothetical protein
VRQGALQCNPTEDERFLLEADLKLMRGELRRLAPIPHPGLDYPV